MARPTRQGVDYFPLDVYLDDKFKFIEIKYKLEGFAILIKLLQRIYSCGYWYRWTEDEMLIFTDENRTSLDLVKNVVDEAIAREIFDGNLYHQYNILTSKGIQKRYKEIVRRRKDVAVIEEYLLIDNNFGVIADIEPTPSEHSDNKSTQSKVKESKVLEYSTFFEEVWDLYPSKVGIGRISDTKKKEVHKLGDEFKRCISRYIDHVTAERGKGFKDLKYQNGSTFFNSGYKDYLDKNYKQIQHYEGPIGVPPSESELGERMDDW